MGIFNRDRSSHGSAERVTRHSRGWAEVRAHLKSNTELRVLDFGVTSSANINFLTSLGQGVYMSNLVQEATQPEWLKPLPADAKPGTAQELDVDRFIDANLDFSGRDFDVCGTPRTISRRRSFRRSSRDSATCCAPAASCWRSFTAA
jgi:hypothetical protein